MAKQNLNILQQKPPLRQLDQLVAQGLLAPQTAATLQPVVANYALSLTADMAALSLQHSEIALQYMPQLPELKTLPQEVFDPIGDNTHSPVKAVVHRHANRVLLKATHVCAVYCRFCFRRAMVGPGGDTITADDVAEGLNYIAAHNEIAEVILTGGDPLVLSVAKLELLMQRLHAMSHVQWLRLHTRLPVVQPARVDAAMCQALAGVKQVWLAVHINHVAELTPQAVLALQRLQAAGVQLISQSVLLRGVNDNVPALQQLFMQLTALGVQPYYLHHPDLTAGTSHFRLSFETGMALMAELQQTMSSLSLPRYVVDIPHGVAEKVPVSPHHVVAVENKVGHYKIRDFKNVWHDYSDVF